MKILYVADGRSQIALNWISYFIRSEHEVYLASTFPCQQVEGLAWLIEIPMAMSEYYHHADRGGVNSRSILREFIPVKLRTLLRQLVAPLSFPQATHKLQEVIDSIQPDLIHAMRIPYEGMITSIALKHIAERKKYTKKPPLLISVWGNDFTLHAKSSRTMSDFTNQALRLVDGLHTDCQRDIRMAMKLGFDISKPNIVLPGAGGIQMDIFHPADNRPEIDGTKQLAADNLITIINPRGFRAYVRNDTFFRSIPLVIKQFPKVRFICPGMKDEAQAAKWIKELGIDSKVELLPLQSRQQMAELFRKSQITVSMTTHDGTPNTLIEAMACGCYPIAGDIDSLHEWIAPGMNGLLVDPGDPKALAAAILKAITQPEVRRKAQEQNIKLVKERAEYGKVMQAAAEFYERLILKE